MAGIDLAEQIKALHYDDPNCPGECAECGWAMPCRTLRLAERDASANTPPDHAPTEQDVIDGRPYIDGNAYWPEGAP